MPYTYANGTLHLMLGRDRQSKALTDLGGGIKKYEREQDHGVLRAAVRELQEESRAVFGEINYTSLFDKIAYIDEKRGLAVIFLPVHPRALWAASVLFTHSTTVKRPPEWDEIVELLWYDYDDFTTMLRSKQMWGRVRPFYRDCISYNILQFALRSANH